MQATAMQATAKHTGRHGPDTRNGVSERVHTLIIGGGQAGLAVGYHLSRRDIPFVIVDANDRIGDAWRQRWDSLRLFTPAKFNGLPGMPFPGDRDVFPTKDEMANYLESYADRMGLSVRGGTRVDRLFREGGRFVAETDVHRYEAQHVVVAMSNYQKPRVPSFAGQLDEAIVQLHSIDYRNPGQLQDGPVLLVGAGNSAAEIAKELSQHGHEVWMSGPDTGQIPFRIEGVAGRWALVRLVIKVVYHRILTVDTPIGKRIRPKFLSEAGPLIRVKPRDLAAMGVKRAPRTVGVRGGKPLLQADGALDVTNVIWCTGFHPGFSWIDIPELRTADGVPDHDRGIVPQVPGLYFVGLHFLYALSSAMVHGVGRDADRIAKAIASRVMA